MTPRHCILMFSSGAFLLLFGLLCLNYTTADGLEHHRAFALQHGLPPPSQAILFTGAFSLILGAGLIGYAIGSFRQTQKASSKPRSSDIA